MGPYEDKAPLYWVQGPPCGGANAALDAALPPGAKDPGLIDNDPGLKPNESGSYVLMTWD